VGTPPPAAAPPPHGEPPPPVFARARGRTRSGIDI
jgi:hypothetical protein